MRADPHDLIAAVGWESRSQPTFASSKSCDFEVLKGEELEQWLQGVRGFDRATLINTLQLRSASRMRPRTRAWWRRRPKQQSQIRTVRIIKTWAKSVHIIIASNRGWLLQLRNASFNTHVVQPDRLRCRFVKCTAMQRDTKQAWLLLREVAIGCWLDFSQLNAKTLTSFSGRPAARALQGPRRSAGWKHFAEEVC